VTTRAPSLLDGTSCLRKPSTTANSLSYMMQARTYLTHAQSCSPRSGTSPIHAHPLCNCLPACHTKNTGTSDLRSTCNRPHAINQRTRKNSVWHNTCEPLWTCLKGSVWLPEPTLASNEIPISKGRMTPGCFCSNQSARLVLAEDRKQHRSSNQTTVQSNTANVSLCNATITQAHIG
jgi:hypothetical protein